MAELTNPHDRFFKDLLSRPEAARDFLLHYLPAEVAALLDTNAFELVKDSFVDAELREYFSDVLFKVRTKQADDAYVSVLFEHKSYPDPMVAFQLMRYMVRVWDQDLRQRGALWPIVPVVVYHGEEPWRVDRNLHSVFEIPEALCAYTPEYRYELCDLSAYDDAQLKGSLLLQVGLLALKYIRHADLRERFPSLVGLLLRELLHEQTAMEFIETVLRYLCEAGDHITEQELRNVMQEVFPEGEPMMATIAEKWVEQGKQQGLEQGLEQGRRQGLLDAIEVDLELRFGSDGLQLLPEIAEIKDLEVLKAIHVGIKQTNSPAELRRIYQKD